MNKFLRLSFLCSMTFVSHTALADCYKCEEIREKNRNLPPLKHEYYEDYLEELRAEGQTLPGDYEITEEHSDE